MNRDPEEKAIKTEEINSFINCFNNLSKGLSFWRSFDSAIYCLFP